MHMVSAQVGCTDEQALALMQARARAVDLPVEEIALAVVERHIRFD
jgi:L-cysteine desulfidase